MRCAMRTRDNSTEPPAAAAAVRGSLMTSVRQDAKRTITHLVTRRGVPGDVSDCWRATSAVRRRLIIIGTAFYDYCSLYGDDGWMTANRILSSNPSPRRENSSVVRL